MEHPFHPRPGYPFSLRCRIEYALSDAGLRSGRATNVGTGPVRTGPARIPISRSAPTVDSLVLRAPGATVPPSDGRGLPTGRSPSTGTEYDFRRPRSIGATRLDSCFTDLSATTTDRPRRPDRPDDAGVTLWPDEQYGYLMLFTGDPLPDVARRSLRWSR